MTAAGFKSEQKLYLIDKADGVLSVKLSFLLEKAGFEHVFCEDVYSATASIAMAKGANRSIIGASSGYIFQS